MADFKTYKYNGSSIVNSTMEYGYFGGGGTTVGGGAYYSLLCTLSTSNGLAKVHSDTYGLTILNAGIYKINFNIESLNVNSGGGSANDLTFGFSTTKINGTLYDSVNNFIGGTSVNAVYTKGSENTAYPGIINWFVNGFSAGNTNYAGFIINSQNCLMGRYYSKAYNDGTMYPGICSSEMIFVINATTTIYFNLQCNNGYNPGRCGFVLQLIGTSY